MTSQDTANAEEIDADELKDVTLSALQGLNPSSGTPEPVDARMTAQRIGPSTSAYVGTFFDPPEKAEFAEVEGDRFLYTVPTTPN